MPRSALPSSKEGRDADPEVGPKRAPSQPSARREPGLVERLARLNPLAPHGRAARHLWVGNGRAHIEVRAADRPEAGAVREAVTRALGRLEGVHWAEVNEVLGRVVVAFDGDQVSPEDLIDAVEAAEELTGVGGETFPAGRPEHPGNAGVLRRHVTALASDLVGIGVGTAGRFFKLPRVPGELAAILPFIDAQPRLRGLAARLVGPPAADLGLALGSAVAQAMAQGPLGLVVDAAHRANQVMEARARQQVWRRREPELAKPSGRSEQAGAAGEDETQDESPVRPRPIPLPRGPIEKSADATGLAAMGAFGATLAITGDPRRAAVVGLAATPKSARLGREAFAAQLGKALADRGAVVMDASVLRLLDRVDTVMIEAGSLTTGGLVIGTVAPAGMEEPGGPARLPPPSKGLLSAKAYALFDPAHMEQERRSGSWALAPIDPADAPPPSPGRAAVLRLTHRGEVVGMVDVEQELDPLAEAVAETVRGSGQSFVVAGTVGGVGHRLGADRIVAGGDRLAASVETLQEEGHVVLLVARRGGAALAMADCGVGLLREGRRPPWKADILCGPGLATVQLLLSALPPARRVSRRSAALAVAGSGVAGALALVGRNGKAAERSVLAINTAALASVASGAWSGFQLSRQPAPFPSATVPWHLLPPERVLDAFGASWAGLSADEVARRGRAVSQRVEPAAWESFLTGLADELANPLTPILGVGAGLSAATGSPIDAGLVGGVAAGSAAFSALYRMRTAAALERLVRGGTVYATVRRDGSERDVPADALVPGDVILAQAGDIVPADVRILEACSLEVDESSLTGESLPAHKHPDPCPAHAIADRTCMLYEGTTIVNGRAVGLVVAVGRATEVGRSLALPGGLPPKGVEARLRSLTRIAVPVSLAGGAALLASGLLHGRPLREAVSSGVALAVAAVPEGLPFVAQAASMAAARRLSARGALVRNIHTIEALGRVDVLCFDKTGTLTEGRLALRLVSAAGEEAHVDDLSAAQRRVLTAALRATPEAGEGSLPHATDQAVADAARAARVGTSQNGGGWQRLAEVPFEPARGYHIAQGIKGSDRTISVKGAPEVVLPACRRSLTPDGPVAIDGAGHRRLQAQVRGLARRGYRVLAVAEQVEASPGDPVAAAVGEELPDGLEFLGFLGFADQVRPSAAGAVEDLRRAGVAVRMITGDHPVTARTIATELGILRAGEGRVMTGPELDALADPELDDALPAVSVFARVTPAHKLRIVGSYQRLGHRVAMTGDGANDAPAIRRADVGIALGRRATPAAREAAGVVVTDDRIETLIDALIEGRALWASLRDALAILLGGNLGEIGFTVAGSALSGKSPLTSRQLLLVNLLTDLGPALAIAVQPPPARSASALLREGPDASLRGALLEQIGVRAAATAAGTTGAWLVARQTGRGARASTVALAALVGTQLGQTVVAGRHSPLVLATAAVSGAALIGIVQTPGISQFFGCTPLGPVAWATAGGAAALATAGSVAVPAAIRMAWRAAGGRNNEEPYKPEAEV